MRYTLYLAHANTLMEHGWKIHEASTDVPLEDTLASPSFEWGEGTLVKAMDRNGNTLYTGAFNDTECVDIGPDSKAIRKFEKGEVFVPQYSLIRRWSLCPKPEQMMTMVYDVLPKPIIVGCLHEIASYVLRREQPASAAMKDLLDGIQRWINGDINNYELGLLDSRFLMITQGVYDSVQSCVSYAASSVYDNIAHAPLCVEYASLACGDMDATLCKIIRTHVPLYEIIRVAVKR